MNCDDRYLGACPEMHLKAMIAWRHVVDRTSILTACLFLFYFISFAKENKTYNVIKLKKGVGRDTATAKANYSGPG